MPVDALGLAFFGLRVALNVSALLVIGLALHAALGVVGREALGRWASFAFALALAVAVLVFGRLLLLNLQMGDGASLLDPDLTALGWTALGPSSLAFWTGAAAVVVGFMLRRRMLLAGGALAMAAGFALTGHTQALPEPGLAPFAVVLHAALAGFWIAAPLTLAPTPAVANDRLLARLKRFSAIALVAIPVLFAAGLWLAFMLAGGVEGLLRSVYGQLLLVKLVAATGALGMGALNQRIVTAKVRKDPPTGRRWLRRTLAVETILFILAVLAVSAATTLTGPGEGVAAQ